MPKGKQTYVKKLHEVRLHQARMGDLKAAEPKTNYNGAGEAEVVPGFQLAKVLQAWTVRYLEGRSKNGSNRIGNVSFGDDEEPHYMFGPVQYISHYSGIHIRRVSGICNGEFVMVPLSQADKILQAIERPDLLGREVQVVPNPNWSPERWYTHMTERTHCDE